MHLYQCIDTLLVVSIQTLKHDASQYCFTSSGKGKYLVNQMLSYSVLPTKVFHPMHANTVGPRLSESPLSEPLVIRTLGYPNPQLSEHYFEFKILFSKTK